MLLYTLTKTFIEVQRNMVNAFDIILFYRMVWWFDHRDIGVEPTKAKIQSLSTNIYYVEYNIHIYIPCTCV
jgi:hypothetical protein